jgi:hypothetical protein
LRKALLDASPLFDSEITREMVEFIRASKRGVVAERKKRNGPDDETEEEEL